MEHRRELRPAIWPTRPTAAEVRALYHSAGLNLTSDLNQLNHATRVSADPAAVRYLERYIVFNGHLSIPVLTMHTTGDGLVVPGERVGLRAGRQARRRLQPAAPGVRRPGRPLRVHARRDDHRGQGPRAPFNTGKWAQPAPTSPKALNATARALGSSYNIYLSGTKTVPTPPAFVHYQPPAYLRPFDLAPGDGGGSLGRLGALSG